MMRSVTLFALAAFLLAGNAARACIQSYGTSLRGETIVIEGLNGQEIVEALQHHEPRKFWEAQARSHAARANGSSDPYVRSNYAVTLLHVGRTNEAIGILEELERTNPGKYVTAANLGTAYELAGDNASALRWIREGIRRNTGSHDGTEWLHVRILNAKLALAADKDWLSGHSVLGLDFGTAVIPKLPTVLPAGNTGKPVKLADLEHALWYQLDERYQFVGAPDPVVASLLFDWANLQFRTGALESATALYREAIRYGLGSNASLAKARLARAEQTLRDHTARQKK